MLDDISSKCALFREFVNGEKWLNHDELAGIAMNLTHIDGGKAFFLGTLSMHAEKYHSYGDKYKSWEYFFDYFSKSDYSPMNCCNFCPYEADCRHSANILLTARAKPHQIVKLQNSDIQYYSLDEVREDMQNALYTAIESPHDCINVIKCEVGAGKTEALLRYMKIAKRPCRIYVPTNKLKRELYNRAKRHGISIMMYPSLYESEIKDTIPANVWSDIQNLYYSGSGMEVSEYIEKYLETNKCPVLRKYLIDKKAADLFEGHIITTHHNLLYSSERCLDRYDNIIDEDILHTILCNHTSVRIADLEKLLEQDGLPKLLISKIKSAVNHAKGKKSMFRLTKIPAKNNVPNADFDTSLFCNAEAFYSDDKNIYYINLRKFEFTKLIILSATADETIYKLYFGEDRVRFHTCKQAKLTGRLIQHGNMSMSRHYIGRHPDIYDRIESVLGELPFISFKGKSRRTDIHFGNSEGHDELRGKSMAVIGTHHLPPWIHKLIAYTLGFDIYDIQKPQVIEYNGYSFRFMTYSNEVLRSIQLWLVESELEQAIGRARLLIEDCTVYLFSNFPLMQSELKEFLG